MSNSFTVNPRGHVVKLLVDLVDLETEIQASLSALRAMEIGIDDDDQVVGQIQLVQVMLDCSLRYLAKNALRYEDGKLTADDVSNS